jgi:D-lyxose ketol-isomerase
VTVSCDGVLKTVQAGGKILLHPGESITITPYLYHNFITNTSGGPVLLGEVSMCNDDENDNNFYDKIGRFPEIEEDEEPYRLLCFEYPKIR